jgi:hypothetical protein
MDRVYTAEQEYDGAEDGTRRSFLRRAVTVAGGAAVAGAALAPSEVGASEANPLLIARAFRDIRRHENAHVAALVKFLGRNARPSPTFQNLTQPDLQTFYKISNTLENTGTGAYNGAAPAIFNPTVLATAASIALIEARHSGFLNELLNKHITTNVFGQEQSFETPLTQAQVLKLAGPFIAGLNGGPPLSFDPVHRSNDNDIRIANFALALEYLEQNFYNINVPKFFGG